MASAEECCGACRQYAGCGAADFVAASRMRPTFQGRTTGGTCNLKSSYSPKPQVPGENQTACVPTAAATTTTAAATTTTTTAEA